VVAVSTKTVRHKAGDDVQVRYRTADAAPEQGSIADFASQHDLANGSAQGNLCE